MNKKTKTMGVAMAAQNEIDLVYSSTFLMINIAILTCVIVPFFLLLFKKTRRIIERIEMFERRPSTFSSIFTETLNIESKQKNKLINAISENEEFTDFFNDIRSTLLDVANEILWLGFDNVKKINSTKFVLTYKTRLSKKHKSLFLFDNSEFISQSYTDTLLTFVKELKEICKLYSNGVRHGKFIDLVVSLYANLIDITASNLVPKLKVESKTFLQKSKMFAKKGDVELAIKYAPSTIDNLEYLIARYNIIKKANSKNETNTEELMRIEMQIISTILEYEKDSKI